MIYLLSLIIMVGTVFLVLLYLVDFRIEFGRPLVRTRRPRDFLKGCGPIELKGTSEWGVLLVHGLSGSPAQMRPLAEALNSDGHSCYVPVLPGHATHPDELFYINWNDWYEAAKEEYLKVRAQHEKVAVIGFSLGAGLGIRLGVEFPDMDALVLISTPIYFFSKYLPTHYVLKLAWLISNVSRSYPQRYPEGPEGPEYLIYPYMPLDALFASRELAADNRRILDELKVPLLMFHSETDSACCADNARIVYKQAKSPWKRLVMFERAPHGMMHSGSEEERALILENIREFLRS